MAGVSESRPVLWNGSEGESQGGGGAEGAVDATFAPGADGGPDARTAPGAEDGAGDDGGGGAWRTAVAIPSAACAAAAGKRGGSSGGGAFDTLTMLDHEGGGTVSSSDSIRARSTKASTSSRTVWKRFSRSFASARAKNTSSDSGSVGTTSRTGGGGSTSTLDITRPSESPGKGRLPVTIR